MANPNHDSSVAQSWCHLGTVKKLVLAVTFDSGDGSFANALLSESIDGFLCRLTAVPGTPAPTNAYSASLVDENGVDVLQGLAAALDTATVQDIPTIMAATSVPPVIAPSNKLTLKISGNTNAGAKTQFILYFSA